MLKTFIHIFRLMSILISTVDLNFKKSIHCYIIYMSFLWSFYFSCNWKNPFSFKALITNQRKTSRSFDRCPFFDKKYHQELCQNITHIWGEKLGQTHSGSDSSTYFFFFWRTWVQSSFKERSSTFKLTRSVRNLIKTRQNIKCLLQTCLRVSDLPLIVICWFTRGAGEVFVADLDLNFCSFFFSNALDKCHCI